MRHRPQAQPARPRNLLARWGGGALAASVALVALFMALLATVLFFSTQIDGYLSARMFSRISTSAAVVLPIAVGQAIVIMTRNIDLSSGSILGVVAYVTGQTIGVNGGRVIS